MTLTKLTTADRATFYRAAILAMRVLDAAESTARRFGSNADARWHGFAGHLDTSDRLDLLVRDAHVRWGAAFSPAQIYGLPGLAEDEPFGPDWQQLAEHEAKRLWATSSQAPQLSDVADALHIHAGAVSVPEIAPTTRLVVAGGAAILGVASAFAGAAELRWSEQVLVVASKPRHRQFAGLVAPMVAAQRPTNLVYPSSDAQAAARAAGFVGMLQPVVSDDASAAAKAFANQVAGG